MSRCCLVCQAGQADHLTVWPVCLARLAVGLFGPSDRLTICPSSGGSCHLDDVHDRPADRVCWHWTDLHRPAQPEREGGRLGPPQGLITFHWAAAASHAPLHHLSRTPLPSLHAPRPTPLSPVCCKLPTITICVTITKD